MTACGRCASSGTTTAAAARVREETRPPPSIATRCAPCRSGSGSSTPRSPKTNGRKSRAGTLSPCPRRRRPPPVFATMSTEEPTSESVPGEMHLLPDHLPPPVPARRIERLATISLHRHPRTALLPALPLQSLFLPRRSSGEIGRGDRRHPRVRRRRRTRSCTTSAFPRSIATCWTACLRRSGRRC